MKKILAVGIFVGLDLAIVLFSGGHVPSRNASASPSIVLLQKTGVANVSVSSAAVSFTSAVQSGDLVVASVSSWPAAPTATSISDSLGNVYSLAGAIQKSSGGAYSAIF